MSEEAQQRAAWGDGGGPDVTGEKFILRIEWPHHPDWEVQEWPVTIEEPFFLIGSEGRYTLVRELARDRAR